MVLLWSLHFHFQTLTVHFGVVFSIFAVLDLLPPVSLTSIPINHTNQSYLTTLCSREIDACHPRSRILEALKGVPAIMPWTILNLANEVTRLTEYVKNPLSHKLIRLFSMSADIINLSRHFVL